MNKRLSKRIHEFLTSRWDPRLPATAEEVDLLWAATIEQFIIEIEEMEQASNTDEYLTTIQRFKGDTEGLAFHEPVFIVYARELVELEQALAISRDSSERLQRKVEKQAEQIERLERSREGMKRELHSMRELGGIADGS